LIPKITVTFIDPSDGYQENYIGFLTDSLNAMYIGSEYGTLFFGRVVPTEQDGFYMTDDDSPCLILGERVDDEEGERIINTLTQVLKKMSGYDFLTNIMLRIPVDIDFNDLIVPGLTKT
jgi:hypothetical protein